MLFEREREAQTVNHKLGRLLRPGVGVYFTVMAVFCAATLLGALGGGLGLFALGVLLDADLWRSPKSLLGTLARALCMAAMPLMPSSANRASPLLS